MTPKGDATVRVIKPESEDDRARRRFDERGYKVEISVSPVVTAPARSGPFAPPTFGVPITLTFTRNGQPVQNVPVSTPSGSGLWFSGEESRRTDATSQVTATLRLRSDGSDGLLSISVGIPTGEDRLLGKAVKTVLVR